MRIEIIKDEKMRDKQKEVMQKRNILMEGEVDIVEKEEEEGGIIEEDEKKFVDEVMEKLRWNERENVSEEIYKRMNDENRMIEDVV